MPKFIYDVSPTSVVLRVKLMDNSVATGAGRTGLVFNSLGLIISTIKIGEASATVYSQAGGTTETIVTLGTYAAPTATKCRFKEVDATNHPGVYEIQIADARFASTDSLLVSVQHPNIAQCDMEIECKNINATRTGTAQSGAAGYIQLDAGASATNDLHVGNNVRISGGTGVGQSRTIISYVGSTQRAYVDRVWATNPDNTSVFVITAGKLTVDIVNTGVAAAGGASTITLASTAVATNEYYDGGIVQIVSGTGIGQSRVINAYTGASRVATVTDAWAVQPDNTSVYIVRGLGDVEANVTGIDNVALSTHASGMMPSDIRDIVGAAVNTAVAQLGVNVVSMVTDAISAAAVSAGAVTKIQTGLATPTNITAGIITTVSGNVNGSVGSIATDGITATSIAADAVNAASLKADAVTKIQNGLATPTNITAGIITTVSGNVNGNVAGSVNSVATTVDADIVKINTSAQAAARLSESAATLRNATVDDSVFAPTSSQFETSSITTAAANHWKGRAIIFTSGLLTGQARTILAYSLEAGKGRFTVNALTSAPLNGVTFDIV